MGRLNEVDDELWQVARAALAQAVDEVAEDAERDLHPDDHHGYHVLRSFLSRWRERWEASARSVDPQ